MESHSYDELKKQSEYFVLYHKLNEKLWLPSSFAVSEDSARGEASLLTDEGSIRWRHLGVGHSTTRLQTTEFLVIFDYCRVLSVGGGASFVAAVAVGRF